jgi:hypothetical protein
MDMAPFVALQVNGSTKHVARHSPLLLMLLASKKLQTRCGSSLSALEERHALPKDWTGTSHLASAIQTGAAMRVVLTCPCRTTFQKLSPSSNVQNQNPFNMLPINGPNLFVAKTSSMLPLTCLPTLTKAAVLFSVMDKQLGWLHALFSQLLTKARIIKPSQPLLQATPATIFLIVLQLIPMQPFAAVPATWFSVFRRRGMCFLSDTPAADPLQPKPNGAVHVFCETLWGVPASTAKADTKTGGLFLNAQEAVLIITALEERGRKQPPTGAPLKTNNSTTHDILKEQVRMKR